MIVIDSLRCVDCNAILHTYRIHRVNNTGQILSVTYDCRCGNGLIYNTKNDNIYLKNDKSVNTYRYYSIPRKNNKVGQFIVDVALIPYEIKDI